MPAWGALNFELSLEAMESGPGMLPEASSFYLLIVVPKTAWKLDSSRP